MLYIQHISHLYNFFIVYFLCELSISPLKNECLHVTHTESSRVVHFELSYVWHNWTWCVSLVGSIIATEINFLKCIFVKLAIKIYIFNFVAIRNFHNPKWLKQNSITYIFSINLFWILYFFFKIFSRVT